MTNFTTKKASIRVHMFHFGMTDVLRTSSGPVARFPTSVTCLCLTSAPTVSRAFRLEVAGLTTPIASGREVRTPSGDMAKLAARVTSWTAALYHAIFTMHSFVSDAFVFTPGGIISPFEHVQPCSTFIRVFLCWAQLCTVANLTARWAHWWNQRGSLPRMIISR